MTTQLERLDQQAFSVIGEEEAREVLGGLAAAGGYTLCNPSETGTTGGPVADKDVDDTFNET